MLETRHCTEERWFTFLEPTTKDHVSLLVEVFTAGLKPA